MASSNTSFAITHRRSPTTLPTLPDFSYIYFLMLSLANGQAPPVRLGSEAASY